jgi:DNA-binding CsgD family transcriptional regulator
VLLLAERGAADASGFEGLPELALDGLPSAEARALLGSVLATRIDEPVVERIIAEARGNPRALLDSVKGVSPAQLAGGYGVPAANGSPRRAADLRQRMERLGPDSRLLLLTAAAEPLGDPALLWRAAMTGLALAKDAGEQLEAEGMVSFGARVLFDDPGSRHLVYGLASPAERNTVHRALATATDPVSDPDRRAWHLAYATIAPDDEIADELSRCAYRARERSGLAGQAAFLDRATLLTADAALRGERALAAATASHDAGAHDSVERLLGIAELSPLDASQQARLAALRARTGCTDGRVDDMVEPLLAAARQLEPSDPDPALHTYLEALAAAIVAGRFGRRQRTAVIAEAVRRQGERAVDPRVDGPRSPAPLLDGLLARCVHGYAAAVEPLKLALKSQSHTTGSAGRPPVLVCMVAPDLWDDERWDTVTGAQVRRDRRTGALATLPYTLTQRALLEVHSGDFAAAAALVKEAAEIRDAGGRPPLNQAAVLLTAWQGEETRAREVIDDVSREAHVRGDGMALTAADHAAAVLYNGLSRYGEALTAARRACAYDEPGLLGWSLVELVEAAVRCDEPGIATEAVERLAERTWLSGTDWALGVEAGSRALLHDGDDPEGLYLESIQRLRRCRITTQLARTQLVYGEWLRRQGRRVNARVHLYAAQRSFAAMGAKAFAERAGRELLATGQRSRRRGVQKPDELTPQEAQIALLAGDGLSNPQIGSRLAISPRTVEYHLHKVFGKLGISSRVEIPLVRPDMTVGEPPATGTPPAGQHHPAGLRAPTSGVGPPRRVPVDPPQR